jgi:hypothetical protein
MPKNINQFARKLIHNPCKPAITAPCLAPKLTADQWLENSSRPTGQVEAAFGAPRLARAC